MKEYIKQLPHQPKKIALISFVLALLVGILGYIQINKRVLVPAKTSATLSADTNFSKDLTLGFLANGRIQSVSVKTGDRVAEGQVLATLDAENVRGALTQARAAYATAQANYTKILNGATGANIDVAKAAVHTAQVNLDGTTKQQDTLVKNFYKNLLNSNIEALPTQDVNNYVAPIISGTYTKNIEGQIKISIYYTGSGGSFTVSGITTYDGTMSATIPQPIGDTGLFIKFPSNTSTISNWTIDIPNKKASNYLANYNAYQLALQTQSQVITNAQALLDQATSTLSALVSKARPEDIAVAQAQVDNASGAVEIAQAAYNATIIKAPSDGYITSVNITPGQIATANAPAIQFTNSK